MSQKKESVRLPAHVLASGDWHLQSWLVRDGADVQRNQRVAVLKSSRGASKYVCAPRSGTLSARTVSAGAPLRAGTTHIAELTYCPHSVVFKGVCAVCGKDAPPAHLAEAEGGKRLRVAYNSDALSISQAEAESVSSATARRLFDDRRLSLVLDLDHTLLHATDDPGMENVLNYAPPDVDLSSVSTFMLENMNESSFSRMFVKLRPALSDFLERVAKKFQLHIYTMGSRPYADKIANLIDPDKRLFSGRITSREDFKEGQLNQKNIQRLFPCDDSMVLIVDDREDVWIATSQLDFMPNLVRARPYVFWHDIPKHESMTFHLLALARHMRTSHAGHDYYERPSNPKGVPGSKPGVSGPGGQPEEKPARRDAKPETHGAPSEDAKDLNGKLVDASQTNGSHQNDANQLNVSKEEGSLPPNGHRQCNGERKCRGPSKSSSANAGGLTGILAEGGSKGTSEDGNSVVNGHQSKERDVTSTTQTGVPSKDTATATCIDVTVETPGGDKAVNGVHPPTSTEKNNTQPSKERPDSTASSKPRDTDTEASPPEIAGPESPKLGKAGSENGTLPAEVSKKPDEKIPRNDPDAGEERASVPGNSVKSDKAGSVADNNQRSAPDNSASNGEPTADGPREQEARLLEMQGIIRRWFENDVRPDKAKHLLRLADVLEECHARFFRTSESDEGISRRQHAKGRDFCAPADVKDILGGIRADVLKGCHVTFTSVIPTGTDPEQNRHWNLARRLGAKCSSGFTHGQTTHLITRNPTMAHTQKMEDVLRCGSAYVVTTQWLEDCSLNFSKQPELWYTTQPIALRFDSQEMLEKAVQAQFEHGRGELKRKQEATPSDIEDLRSPKRRKSARYPGGSGQLQSPGGSGVILVSPDQLEEALDELFD